jgi:transcriptional regulator with XRE-family HTH domain
MMPANQATPNARLRRQRLRRGWSLQRVADELQKICEQEGRRVGVTASMVGKWERGFKRPSPFYQENLCSLYGMTAEQLGLVDDTGQTAPTWFDENGTLAETLESWRHDVERRAFFRHLSSFAGAAMFAPAIDALGPEQLHERLAQALDRPSRVDQATMRHVETVTDQFRRLDDRIGSRDLLGPVLGHLRFITRLLQGSQPIEVHRRLCVAASQVAQLAGWLSFDANQHTDARAYYDVALKAADEGNDRALGAYVLGCRGVVEIYGGQPETGLQLAQAALSRGRSAVTATTQAWLHRVEALALAALGEADPCSAALHSAEEAISRSSTDEDPAWIYHFNRSQLAGQKGACYVRLHRPQDAREALGEALTTLSPEFVRDRSLHLTHLASAFAQQGEIEEACRRAAQSLEIVVQTGSARELRRLREFRRELEEFSDSRAVKELDAQLLLV